MFETLICLRFRQEICCLDAEKSEEKKRECIEFNCWFGFPKMKNDSLS